MNQATTQVDQFPVLAAQLQASFTRALSLGVGEVLYTTDADDLFEHYLSGFDSEEERQHHNCSCCRHFLQRYGSLVIINAQGGVVPAMWAYLDAAKVPEVYAFPVVRMLNRVKSAKITGIFKSKDVRWGDDATYSRKHSRSFSHFRVTPPSRILSTNRVLTARQEMAQLRQDFQMLRRGLEATSESVLRQALALFESEKANRHDKFKPLVTQLLALKLQLAAGKPSNTLLWQGVASLPVGGCNLTSSALGSLLQDLGNGMYVASATRRFNAVVYPLVYQRPTAAPTVGAVQAAEKLVEKLGLAPAFQRRFASLIELRHRIVWDSTSSAEPAFMTGVAKPKPAGVFAGLSPQATPATPVLPAGVKPVTMVKFLEMLPTFQALQVLLDGEKPLGAITAAVDEAAPALLAWDKDDARNPYGWYKHVAVEPAQFGLGSEAKVLAVVPVPAMWDNPHTLHVGYVLVLEGAQETQLDDVGLALLPEMLRADIRPAARVIAAHSDRTQLGQVAGQNAAGLVIRKGQPMGFRVAAVLPSGATAEFIIDRWE